MATKQILVLTGLAGAGKSTAAHALEDLGFFVVDNLPPRLIRTLVELADSSGGELRRMVFVVDAREARFLAEFGEAWDELKASGHDLRLVFLDCEDEVLVRRFKETRRRHPNDEGDGIQAAITRERGLLAEMHHRADDIIQTGKLTVHELKRLITERFGSGEGPGSQLTILSFGFKHGLPPELDLCFDARFLPNPYFVEALRAKTGLEDEVYQHVLDQADTGPFLDRIEDLVTFLLPRFHHEGKSYVTVALGCTGGRHRSVSLARALGERLEARGVQHQVVHRDVEKV